MSYKDFSHQEVLSLLDFSKSQEQLSNDSKTILSNWIINKNNNLSEEDEHGLSVVGIYEQPIIIKNKIVGRVVIFNYTGVGGGWHNKILQMVEEKYFQDELHYTFIPSSSEGFYNRIYFVGEKIFDTNKWEKYENNSKIRIHKQFLDKTKESDKLGRGILTILYDYSDDGRNKHYHEELKSYSHFWDGNSNVQVFIADINKLRYKPSKAIIKQRIKERTNVKSRKNNVKML